MDRLPKSDDMIRSLSLVLPQRIPCEEMDRVRRAPRLVLGDYALLEIVLLAAGYDRSIPVS